ncbi:hypothetical protein ABIC83_002681 [Roseateles asaccharophilus]|uniref:hypothetical protein n=1 Tax=Roseateles asaccharophilus TaxID=582607 RepID=UPI00383756CE
MIAMLKGRFGNLGATAPLAGSSVNSSFLPSTFQVQPAPINRRRTTLGRVGIQLVLGAAAGFGIALGSIWYLGALG